MTFAVSPVASPRCSGDKGLALGRILLNLFFFFFSEEVSNFRLFFKHFHFQTVGLDFLLYVFLSQEGLMLRKLDATQKKKKNK